MCYANHRQFSNSIINLDSRLIWYAYLTAHAKEKEKHPDNFMLGVV